MRFLGIESERGRFDEVHFGGFVKEAMGSSIDYLTVCLQTTDDHRQFRAFLLPAPETTEPLHHRSHNVLPRAVHVTAGSIAPFTRSAPAASRLDPILRQSHRPLTSAADDYVCPGSSKWQLCSMFPHEAFLARAKKIQALGYSGDDAMSMAAYIGGTSEVNQSGDLVVLLNEREVIFPISLIQPDSDSEDGFTLYERDQPV